MKIWKLLSTILCISKDIYGPEEKRWVKVNKDRNLGTKWDWAVFLEEGWDLNKNKEKLRFKTESEGWDWREMMGTESLSKGKRWETIRMVLGLLAFLVVKSLRGTKEDSWNWPVLTCPTPVEGKQRACPQRGQCQRRYRKIEQPLEN